MLRNKQTGRRDLMYATMMMRMSEMCVMNDPVLLVLR